MTEQRKWDRKEILGTIIMIALLTIGTMVAQRVGNWLPKPSNSQTVSR